MFTRGSLLSRPPDCLRRLELTLFQPQPGSPHAHCLRALSLRSVLGSAFGMVRAVACANAKKRRL